MCFLFDNLRSVNYEYLIKFLVKINLSVVISIKNGK